WLPLRWSLLDIAGSSCANLCQRSANPELHPRTGLLIQVLPLSGSRRACRSRELKRLH
ncbi:MAG: hypothetical protein AVDCRST_MAG93-3405, partial [uncultured Chloroflexia bacterium]